MVSKTSKVIVTLSSLLVGSSAMASGYAVKLPSGLSAGMASAGSGVGDDALAIYANPAAMIQSTTHQVAGHFTGVFGLTKFKGRASTPGARFTGGTQPSAVNETRTTRNAAKKVAVPSFGVVANAHDRVKVGVMVHAPFGLKFNYGNESVVRGHVTRAEMTTINIVPSVAIKIIDSLAFGAGLQMQYNKVDLARKAFLSTTGMPQGSGLLYSLVSGNDWSMGWTAGLFSQVTKAWKVGLSYKSQMTANLDGQGQLSTLTGTVPAGGEFKAKAKVHFPHTFSLSSSYDLNSSWTAYMDVIYTKWNVVKDILIASFRTPVSQDVIPLKWKNTWFFSVGASYKLNENWTFRTGYGYDISPTRNATRVASIPDSNKHWIAIGTTYNMGKNLAMTLSYGHEFFQKGKINLQQGLATDANASTYNKGSLVGKVKNRVDLVSLQFNYKF
ncbi:MAG: outer membrane protein transport protein [Candidatus Paracaedibacteraceae bacterium]|nr:outer membrane protein transport protein [Candidatus Paracaedibacteraceae bacterium]